MYYTQLIMVTLLNAEILCVFLLKYGTFPLVSLYLTSLSVSLGHKSN